jgi:hypothetical protein
MDFTHYIEVLKLNSKVYWLDVQPKQYMQRELELTVLNRWTTIAIFKIRYK